ncbi:MAG: RNB domain-containing ribonuclease [Betaproteobacteria bacterium]|nr:MAG: RNB domain-containing ribonuclease [Betaproteobacteria bacterium]
MQLLYEEEGALKVGTVLAQAPASFQIESPHGRRTKIKAASVLLEFERPAGTELLAAAEKFAEELDVDFLWQCSGTREFGFRELAREYVGRDPSPVEAAGVLMKLHSAPMYFYRRGKGRFQPAPEETLKLALAGIEKKKRVQQAIEAWAGRLARFDCPPEVAALRDELLYGTDRNKPEAKALEQACRSLGLTPARLFERCGLLPDPHEYHLQRFLHEFFPAGTGFAAHEVPTAGADLPLAGAAAFSLDDVGTTEIDDAFSVQPLADGKLRIGVHIAAPGLGFGPGSPLDAIARERLSTAYMPGSKITMLPEDVIERFSLDHGGERPAVSLYLDVSEEGALLARHTRLERVRIIANLRHAQYDVLNEAFEAGKEVGLPHEEELRSLWRVALASEARRGRPAAGAMTLDYSFYIEDGRVRIVPRKRGAPLDKLVSEMMILANTSWGELLAERDVAALYRVQSTGKVRMSVHPEPHEGLGVSCYAWMSSPLRRYVDLVNQWQLIAAVSGQRAPYARNSDALLAALRAFEVTYARYDEQQRVMETYWTLRWLAQEQLRFIDAVVLRENLIRADGLPLVTRVPSLPDLEPGTRVRLEVAQMDFLERSVSLVYRETLGKSVASVEDDAAP